MSIKLLLDMAVAGQGDRIALGPLAGGTTFGKLAELAAGGGAILASENAREAVLLARNGPILPHLLFSAAHAGIPFVPLNYRLTTRQIHELLEDLDSPFVIADDDYRPMLLGKVPSMSTAEFIEGSDKQSIRDAAILDDTAPAVLLFTSGTTSKPKIVPLRHENLQAYIFSTVDFTSAAKDDVALVTVPPYHVAAIGSALSNLCAGRRVVYLPDFAANRWLDLVRDECVTTAMVVPTMLSRIVEHLAGAPAETPSLRVISYGGARMPIPVLEQALAAFPDTGFVNAYGLTETSSTIALLGPDDHRAAFESADEKSRARLGSAGRPTPGVEMQVRNDSGTPLGSDEIGELWVRGPQVSGEYVGVGSVLDENGWFPTKDRAWLDNDGYLFIEGRSDDTIIRGGENLAPTEIEDVLASHPAIADAAVVGVEDDEWGQRLVAVIVTRKGMTVEGEHVKQHVRARLRGSRTPDDVVFWTDLPYTATGKLLRREIIKHVSEAATATLVNR